MRRYAGAILIVIAVSVAWIWALPKAPVSQPIAFPHAKHQKVGCTVCHSGATAGAHAGIPEPAFCVRCHATAPAGTGQAWDRAVAAKSFGWVRLERLPDHVMFSHRRHVTLGRLACESCHGEMKTRVVPMTVAPRRLEMTTCLDCHRQLGTTEDCDACHR
jgi:hypothetical protein